MIRAFEACSVEWVPLPVKRSQAVSASLVHFQRQNWKLVTSVKIYMNYNNNHDGVSVCGSLYEPRVQVSLNIHFVWWSKDERERVRLIIQPWEAQQWETEKTVFEQLNTYDLHEHPAERVKKININAKH